jgi:hypothetical protein
MTMTLVAPVALWCGALLGFLACALLTQLHEEDHR